MPTFLIRNYSGLGALIGAARVGPVVYQIQETEQRGKRHYSGHFYADPEILRRYEDAVHGGKAEECMELQTGERVMLQIAHAPVGARVDFEIIDDDSIAILGGLSKKPI